MSPVKEWTITKPHLHISCEVGEAPFYSKARNQFRFLDIPKQKLYLVDLNADASSLRTIDLQNTVSVTANIDGDDETILVGAKSGFAKLHLPTGKLTMIKSLWDAEVQSELVQRLRLNDGAIDSHGRFFAGVCNDPTFTSEIGHDGILFRLDPDLSLHRVLSALAVPNGIGWAVNEDIIYVTESLTRDIHAFSYDASTGVMSDQRVFFHLDPAGGAPDGLVVDAEDHIWTAIYGGGMVMRLTPDGEVAGVVRLPTRCVTCAVFVGTELWITSGADPEPEKYVKSGEVGGSVFRVDVGVEGRKVNSWRQLAA